jgi:hypothetical protein
MPDSVEHLECDHCRYTYPLIQNRWCPHCAEPSLHPNVAVARKEAAILDGRYRDVIGKLADPVRAIAAKFSGLPTVAVINRTIEQSIELALNDHRLLPTYYQMLRGEFRVPTGDRWDRLRFATDSALFPGFHEDVRFAALSMNCDGLWNYGEVVWILKEHMIERRASVFEENSVLWMKHHNIRVDDAASLPEGYRATWADRGRLCVIKLGHYLDESTTDQGLSELLLSHGATSDEDRFVEVHIHGPISIRTVNAMVVSSRASAASPEQLSTLRRLAATFDVTVAEA